MSAPLLEIEELRVVHRGRGAGEVEALRGVDLRLGRGRTLAVVGPSGAGKSTLARCVVGVDRYEGRVAVEGREVREWSREAPRAFRGRVQLLLQNPRAALDPRLRIGEALREVTRIHGGDPDPRPLLEAVGLGGLDPDRRPHEISGGEAQRVCLARALAVRPELLVLDEPTSSLDPPTRREIIRLLVDLQQLRGLTYLYIAHDLGLVRAVADEICVLDEGRIVERGETSELFAGATHDVTRALLAARPLAGWRAGVTAEDAV